LSDYVIERLSADRQKQQETGVPAVFAWSIIKGVKVGVNIKSVLKEIRNVDGLVLHRRAGSAYLTSVRE
jgi:hypothetical protein